MIGIRKVVGEQECQWVLPAVLEKHTIALRNQLRNNADAHAKQLKGL
jgi:hypothetical protein